MIRDKPMITARCDHHCETVRQHASDVACFSCLLPRFRWLPIGGLGRLVSQSLLYSRRLRNGFFEFTVFDSGTPAAKRFVDRAMVRSHQS
jgi:hypothetical protein